MHQQIRRIVSASKLASLIMAHCHILCRKSYLRENGWLESAVTGQSCDRQKRPIPWYTYAAIAFIADRIKPDMAVFEYGSGNSTLWWSERVRSVVSCEHNPIWYKYMSMKMPSNVKYIMSNRVEEGQYAQTISKDDTKYDIVVIDGRDRNCCARYAVMSMKDDGIVVWDNSDRSRYAEGIAFMAESGFKRIGLNGLGPINSYAWETSIFYRTVNCLNI